MRDGDFLPRNSTLRTAAAIAAASIGAGVVTGRETAAFFAQTTSAAGLGILCAGAVFGAMTAGLARTRMLTGAHSTAALAARLPNRVGGGTLCAVHGALLAAMSVNMLASAWEIGALTLPTRCGGFIGAILALMGAAALANAPKNAQIKICAAFYGTALLYALALLGFGRLPAAADTYIEAELRLAGSKPAAALLGTAHGCMRVCVAANLVMRYAEPTEAPWRIGVLSGGMYALCLTVLNEAIRKQPEFAAALRMPLTALATGWGKAGFAAVSGMTFLAAAVSLYAATLPLFRRKAC